MAGKLPKSIRTSDHLKLVGLLRKRRVERNILQEDLAKKLGRPQSFVSKYEAGERRLDLLEVRVICSHLGLTLIEFAKQLESVLSP
jgi:transcriptional regulator with XRE-family HTH domain